MGYVKQTLYKKTVTRRKHNGTKKARRRRK